jgi:hypothetical protein
MSTKTYEVLEASDSDRLAELVSWKEEQGWECQGGVAVACYIVEQNDMGIRYGWVWAQGMVRDNKKGGG